MLIKYAPSDFGCHWLKELWRGIPIIEILLSVTCVTAVSLPQPPQNSNLKPSASAYFPHVKMIFQDANDCFVLAESDLQEKS
jgi:hypothetical protein